MHGVAVKTVRRWRRLYQRQGKARGAGRPSSCPRCDDAPLDATAYAHLLGWYLGDGHIAAARRGVFVLAIFCDERYPGLHAEVLETMRLVKPSGKPHQRHQPGLINTAVSWKHWPCLFPQHGPGRKHERPMVLADWQRALVEAHPGRLLRGLFHSDGCRITNWTTKTVAGEVKRYEYPRYFFKNSSFDILALCCWALDLLSIRWRRPSPTAVSVARRDAVAALDEHVGPKY
jgi:hypothetical protein